VVPLRLAPGERAIGRVSFRKASIGPAPVLTWHVTAGGGPAGAPPTPPRCRRRRSTRTHPAWCRRRWGW
jgi:hypothetical protein